MLLLKVKVEGSTEILQLFQSLDERLALDNLFQGITVLLLLGIPTFELVWPHVNLDNILNTYVRNHSL
jgi:hypothetical protein